MDLQSPQKILPNSTQLVPKPKVQGWGQTGNITIQSLSENPLKALVTQALKEWHNLQSIWD